MARIQEFLYDSVVSAHEHDNVLTAIVVASGNNRVRSVDFDIDSLKVLNEGESHSLYGDYKKQNLIDMLKSDFPHIYERVATSPPKKDKDYEVVDVSIVDRVRPRRVRAEVVDRYVDEYRRELRATWSELDF